jgi:uncharacterized protein (TIGR01777 family)
MRVFVTGATGLIGTRLVPQLIRRGDQVVALTRRASAARERLGPDCEVVEGDPMREGGWMDRAAQCDAIVHLAGENIFAHRWNAEFKELLRASRVQSTANVVRAITRQPQRANGQSKVLVSSSGINYYGPHGDEKLDESSPSGDDFLARLCIEWENAAQAAESAGIRVARIRTGIVLDRTGGALAQMLTPFRFFVGGPIGAGKQWMSWIHHADMIGILLLALDHAGASGPLNATAPQPVTNKEFSRSLGRALHRPAFLPTPAFALRLMLGEAAQLVTTGQRVLPKKALALGYSFRFATLDAALADLLG